MSDLASPGDESALPPPPPRSDPAPVPPEPPAATDASDAAGGAANRDDRSVTLEALADTLRPYAGWILFGFAVLFVLLGWFGISGESVVAKQLPYLISGGIGGVLLAVLGATFLGIEELRRDGGRLDRMEQQIDELHRILLERPDAPRPAADETVGGGSDNGHVVVVEAGESYHRSSCALVAGKDTTVTDSAGARGRGLRPCPVCEPATA